VVTPYSVTFDGSSHTASGTAAGVNSEVLTGLDLSGTTHTNAGTYAADTWTFSNDNYNSDGATVTDHIAKADATIHVTPYSVTFDGNAHTASGTATGVGGADLSSLLTLSGTTHTNAGTYATDAWNFAGGINYNDASGTVSDHIGKATATIVVTPYNVTFDGSSHTATGTATGVGGADLSSLLDLSGTTHTNPGTYATDAWSFAGNGNYNSAGGTITDKIQYRWDGFLQPINDTAHQVGVTTSSVFKGGSTVPVKFQLKKADGTVVLWNGTSAVPVWQTPLQGSAMSAPPNETVYGDSATTGGAFRWDSTGQQWIYNWSTKGFKTGYWWKVCATFDDGQTQCVNIGLS